MTLYLDTSLLVAALTNETETRRMQAWLGEQEPSGLAISDWVITEFSAALSMKLRSGQIEAIHRAGALAMFTRLSVDSLTILLVSGLPSAQRHDSRTSICWACAPAMPCISPSAPITVQPCAR